MAYSPDVNSWDAMLECWKYQRYMPKPTNIVELKTALSTIWNDLPQDFDHVSLLQLIQLGRHCEDCLNTGWAANIHYWNIWTVDKKLCEFDSLFVNVRVQLHVHFINSILKSKQLYLLNRVSCFGKNCRICCINNHISSLKAWLKSILPLLKYRCYPTGFFYWCTLYICVLAQSGSAIGHSTCEQEVEVRLPVRAQLRNNFGQVVHTCLCVTVVK